MNVMRLFFAFTVFAVCLGLSPAWAETLFFRALPDIPVAKQLTPLPEQATVFDKPAGRFAQAVALIKSPDDKVEIRSYYQSSLPAFGWVQTADTTYKRGNETLTFWFEDYQGEAYFYISIEP